MTVHIDLPVLEEIKSLPTAAIKGLWENLIYPVNNGLSMPELQGKYKPSWAVTVPSKSPMVSAMLSFAKKHSLHHYHIGYPFYKSGRDPKYPGDESAAIVHLRPVGDDFYILRYDQEHPRPFTVPMNIKI